MKLLHIADFSIVPLLGSPSSGTHYKNTVSLPGLRTLCLVANEVDSWSLPVISTYDTEQQTVTAQHFFLKQLERLHIA